MSSTEEMIKKASEIINLEDVSVCPECGSSNIIKANMKKRGILLLFLAAIYLFVVISINALGHTWFGLLILLVFGIISLSGKKYRITCKDCLCKIGIKKNA